MNHLLLDISPKKIVWASNVAGRSTGTKTLYLMPGEDPTMRFRRCEEWLAEMVKELGPIDYIFCITAPHKDGERTACLEGLAKTIEDFGAKHNIIVRRFSKASLSKRAWKYATGEKTLDKDQVIRSARVCGWSPNDYREALTAFMLELFLDVAADGP
jgi:hypothetical protein